MLKKVYCTFFFCLSIHSIAQNNRLSGYIVDRSSRETLIGAVIYDTISKNSISTNDYGYFSLQTQSVYFCEITYAGYDAFYFYDSLQSNIQVEIKLERRIELSEVVVKGNKFKDASLSHMQIQPGTVKSMPSIGGESDVLKTLQLLPGVQQNKEGNSGFSVRGGSHDQNLFIMDGVPVYNVNHLFGFFSVFSPDAINNCTFLKGGIPARYGGRLSSVVDLRLKEGNNEKIHGNTSVGIISAKVTLEGPVAKDKSTFFFTGRRTYIDLFSRPVSNWLFRNSSAYYFQDYTLKTNYSVNAKNKLYLSAYFGNDQVSLQYSTEDDDETVKFKTALGWGNIISAFRWNCLLKENIFSNLTLYYSYFKYNTYNSFSKESKDDNTLLSSDYSGYFSRVLDQGFNWDIDFFSLNKNHIKTGIELIRHNYSPGMSKFEHTSIVDLNDIDTIQGTRIMNYEASIYIEDNFHPYRFLKINLGIRHTYLLSDESVFPGFQPRALIRVNLNKNLSMSASYNLHFQFVHLLTNSNIGTPSDLWLPSMKNLPPQKAQQFSLGIMYELMDKFSFSIEAYQKYFENQLEIRQDVIFNNQSANWSEILVSGRGNARGIEFSVEKSNGKNKGWLSYTLAKSDRTFPEINNGETYPFKYDRRHNISLFISHQFNERKQLNVSWIYTSGYYITLNEDSYHLIAPGFSMEVENFQRKNNYKTPAYHHLDINYSTKKKKKHGIREWSFGVYNLYSRINPFLLYYEDVQHGSNNTNMQTIKRELKIVGLFPIIPSVSYAFIF